MKTIYFLLICVWLGLITNNVCAQQRIQIKYGNEIYNVYGSNEDIYVVNSNNTLNMNNLRDRCICEERESAPILSNIVKSVFCVEKQKALAGDRKRITCTFYYDVATGQILNVDFWLKGVVLSEKEESLTTVTLKEIHQMEILFKRHRFKIDCDCSEYKYGYVLYTYPLNKMAD